MILSDISVKRPVFATVISLLLVAFGLISFSDLSVRELPDVDPPIVGIKTNYPGANAAIVETRITQIIESAIAGVAGIKTIQSSSEDGESNISVEFELERDIDSAANDIRDRVSRVLNNLPEESEPPEVSKADNDTEAIIWFNLTSPSMDILQLTDYADRNIVDRLSVVDGVSNIKIGGRQRYALRIHLDRQAMAARQITVIDVENALRQENVELPAGKVESIQRDTIVRLNREYEKPEDFKTLVIRDGGQGDLVRLSDIATIEMGSERDKRFFHVNGVTAIGLGIVKQSTANTLSVANGAKEEVERILVNLPENMSLEVAFDSSIFIEEAISEVYVTLGIAMGLVILVLYMFLGNIRTVLVPAVTVPICIIASFLVLSLMGVSINLITLLGLVMSIGLVVDDAIVVLENISRRVDLGEPGLIAAYRGSRQVGFAVIATTLVLIGVFVPIVFLPGNIGLLFGELAITMSAAVGFSSLIALTLTPMLCSKLVRRRNKKTKFSHFLDRSFKRLEASYGVAIESCLNNKALVILAFCTCFALIAGLMPRIPNELAPAEDRSNIMFRIKAPEGSSYQFLEEQAYLVEEQLLPYVKKGDEIDRLLIRVDTGGGFGFVTLVPWGERERSAEEILNEVRPKLMQNVTGMNVIPFIPKGLSSRSGGGEDFNIVIGGSTYEELSRYKQVILEQIADYPGLLNVDTDLEENQPQYSVKIDRPRAADMGVSIQSIGSTLETMMGGRKVTTFVRTGEEYDVILQAQISDRRQPLDMENIHVKSSRTGELIPLSNLVRVDAVSGAAELNRYNRVRALTISGVVAPGYSMGEVTDYMENTIREALPDVISVDYKGATLEFKEAGSDIYFVFVMALLIVFLVLAAQFESFIHPFIIMLTVPLAVLGGLVGLYLSGSSMNIYSQLGLIMLIGLAAKNGILIVEFANQKRDEGMVIRDALIDGAKTRLRPIMMTGLSTAMGAVPLMVAAGAGSASRQTIGVVVFSGVIVATFFTLFIVPVFYDLLAKYTKAPSHVADQLDEIERKEKAGIPAE
ncbi:efflux RND transporter permease subunit [Kordiimonas pumila]|uniref:Efflux RND transporter permease subunit n=1 Tax=Kordiimonas pumila TaxID=2161677 RepID=A0ABV7D150_9PROT|nr:efflux RND transporter permease subunit [Kordiimonas pumila]